MTIVSCNLRWGPIVLLERPFRPGAWRVLNSAVFRGDIRAPRGNTEGCPSDCAIK